MKKLVYLACVLMIGAITITSCRKYEEGPNIRLRSKEARIANNWRIESAQLNGVNVSADPYYTKQKHFFYRNKSYINTIINTTTLEATNLTGEWKLFDNDSKIAITTKNFSGNIDSTVEYNIIKLYNKQFWIRRTDNTLELHFIPTE
jgi:hypothetical protein